MATTMRPPPRTPSPKIRIHKSQSFDSPSSRITITPIDDSPYSKSASSIFTSTNATALPAYDALKAAERAMVRSHADARLVLHTKMSDESMLSDSSAESMSDVSSSPSASPASGDSRFALFGSGSPEYDIPSAPSPPPLVQQQLQQRAASPLQAPSIKLPLGVEIVTPDFSAFQDASSPMYDPWLVRVVLDMFDVRGLDWMDIADVIGRVWGFRTCSADVLGILGGNGRIRDRVWWD